MNKPNDIPTTARRSTVRTGLAGVAIGTAALVGGLTVLPAFAGAQDIEPETPDTEIPPGDESSRHRPRLGFRAHKIETVTEVLDLSAEEIHEAFQNGTTLAELSEAQGVPVDTLIDALVTATESEVAEHLEAGDITQEQADRILESLEERVTTMVNADRPIREGRGRHGHRHRGHGIGAGSEVVTDLLGLTQEEIREAFQNGTTLAELAESQGVSTDALVDALVAEAEARVAEKVEAGDITAERADSILEDLEERIEDRVTSERPAERRGRRGGLRGGVETTIDA
ncbi:MAG: hypothetical protein HKN24_02235 [Acidimicrobiales bacterium]|nr:hypothetical protein [Acidimicrobiales bacterium]